LNDGVFEAVGPELVARPIRKVGVKDRIGPLMRLCACGYPTATYSFQCTDGARVSARPWVDEKRAHYSQVFCTLARVL